MIPELVTDRLVLRALRGEDAEALHALYGDPAANTWSSRPATATMDETRARVASTLAGSDWRAWAITLAGEDHAIGTLAAHEKRQGGVVEIGYQLARAHWGLGLAREAVAGLIEHLFGVEGHRRIFADSDPDNVRSIHLLEALGFRREGLLRAEWETHIGVRDSVILGLLAEEWKLSDR